MKKQFILSIKFENEKQSKTIILDKFENLKEANEWVEWLKEVYNKVKEKNEN